MSIKDHIISKLDDIIMLEEPDIPSGRIGVCDDFLPSEVFFEVNSRMKETEKINPVKDWNINEPYTIPSRDAVMGSKTTHSITEFTDTKLKPLNKIGMPDRKNTEYKHPTKVTIEFMEAWNSKDVLEAYAKKFNTLEVDDHWYGLSSKDGLSGLEDYRTIARVHSYAPGWWYGVHKDHADKLFSIVIYMFPEEPHKLLKYPLGTEIYSDLNNSYYGHVEWKLNRAIIFQRSKNPCHSFTVPKQMKHHRWCLMLNIVKKDSFLKNYK